MIKYNLGQSVSISVHDFAETVNQLPKIPCMSLCLKDFPFYRSYSAIPLPSKLITAGQLEPMET